MAHFQGLFLEKWILWKSSILKRFIFLVPEYANLTGVKTYRDGLENSGKGILEQRVQILILESVEDLIEASDAVWSLPFHSSVCFAHETSEIFRFCSRLPFRVFTLESFFLSTFIFHHFFTVLLCTWQFKIHPEQVKDWSRLFCWLRKRDNSLVDYEKFLKEENSSVQVSTLNQNGLSGM